MKQMVMTAAVLLIMMIGMAQAQEGALHGSIDVTYQSKYVWRGFDIFGDKSAIQPSVDLDLFGTGFGASVAMHRANSGEYENFERWDYYLYYGNRMMEGQPCATNYRLGWVYYNYPDNSRKDLDLEELHAILSWPNILPVEGLVPTYVLVKLWPANSGSLIGSRAAGSGTSSGFAHIFMLDYGLPIGGLVPDTPEQVLHLHSELVFNDGVHPVGGNADHDWSNVVFGVATDFDLGNNLTLTPGVYHQVTMDDSVNDDKDETWITAGIKYKF
jgi:hypothetical protein